MCHTEHLPFSLAFCQTYICKLSNSYAFPFPLTHLHRTYAERSSHRKHIDSLQTSTHTDQISVALTHGAYGRFNPTFRLYETLQTAGRETP